MAKKDFDEYFEQVASQYIELLNDVRDMEQEVANGIISPERLENMEKMIQPIKVNFMRLSYVKFLLDQPNKKSKRKAYVRHSAKLLKALDGHKKSDVLEENRQILDNLEL